MGQNLASGHFFLPSPVKPWLPQWAPRLQGILQVDGLHIHRHAAHVDAPCPERWLLSLVEGWLNKAGFFGD